MTDTKAIVDRLIKDFREQEACLGDLLRVSAMLAVYYYAQAVASAENAEDIELIASRFGFEEFIRHFIGVLNEVYLEAKGSVQ